MTTAPANREEAKLLVEAVSLLLQREQEIETAMTDRFRKAQLRAADVAQRWNSVDQRLSRVEQRLAELAPSIDPQRAGAAVVSQLKYEVESLPIRIASSANVGGRLERTVADSAPEVASQPKATTSAWALLGDTAEARLGAVLIGVGALVLVVVLFMQAGM
jgi:hypothetical protein